MPGPQGPMTEEEKALLAQYSGGPPPTRGPQVDPQEMELRQAAARVGVPGAMELPLPVLMAEFQKAKSMDIGGEASMPPGPNGALPGGPPPGGALGAGQEHNDRIKQMMGQGG